MLSYKCKKSVFCIYFLIFFFIGTICGVFSFCCLMEKNGQWVYRYSGALSAVVYTGFVEYVLTWLRPVLVMLVLSVHPGGYCAVFPLILIRGFLVSYCFCALWVGNCDICIMLLVGLVVLPVYYMFCGRTYFRWGAPGE